MNIFAAKLNYDTTDETLQAAFEEFGEVDSAKVIMDKFTGRSKGFGFVEMSDDAAAAKAMAEVDGSTADGRVMKAVEAKPREDKPGFKKRSFSKSW